MTVSMIGYTVCTHQGVHFQLLDALCEQLVCLSSQLDEMGRVESEALVVRPRQLASKCELVCYGIKVLELLELVLCAPWEDV